MVSTAGPGAPAGGRAGVREAGGDGAAGRAPWRERLGAQPPRGWGGCPRGQSKAWRWGAGVGTGQQGLAGWHTRGLIPGPGELREGAGITGPPRATPTQALARPVTDPGIQQSRQPRARLAGRERPSLLWAETVLNHRAPGPDSLAPLSSGHPSALGAVLPAGPGRGASKAADWP